VTNKSEKEMMIMYSLKPLTQAIKFVTPDPFSLNPSSNQSTHLESTTKMNARSKQ
jgi:hypothetical protein